MSNNVSAIPKGMHTITPHLAIKGAAQAIEFYKQALGAKEESRLMGPDGQSIMHAKLVIGDSALFITDEMPSPNCQTKSPQSLGGTACVIHLYVEDVDAVFAQAVAAGAKVTLPVTDMFWGDRYGQFVDPFGHVWSCATHVKDLTHEEIEKGGREMCAQMAAARK